MTSKPMPAAPSLSGAEPPRTFWYQYGPTILSVGFILVVYVLLHSINRQMLWFPTFSSILFPALAISPFFLMRMRIPGRIKVALILALVLVLLPILGIEDSFYLELATQIAIYGAMAIGLNIVVGFAGLLDLGYIAFFAVGAYLWGVFTSQAQTVVMQGGATASPELFWLFLAIGVIAAAVAGILLGLPVLRLRGDYLAIVTLGFGEMIRILVSNLGNVSGNPRVVKNITNGAQGLHGIGSPPLPAFLTDITQGIVNVMNGIGLRVDNTNMVALTQQLFFYFLVLLVGVLAVIVAARLENSPVGRAWTAIREDETAAQAMGVPKVRMKLMAFAIGASFAGAMGVIFAAKNTFVSPESFSFNQSIFILVIVIVGGMGSIRGVLLGAIVVTLLNLQVLKNFSLQINALRNIDFIVPILNWPIKNWPVQLDPARYERLVFGVLLVVMMIRRPAGILPAQRRRLELAEAMGKGTQVMEQIKAEEAARLMREAQEMAAITAETAPAGSPAEAASDDPQQPEQKGAPNDAA